MVPVFIVEPTPILLDLAASKYQTTVDELEYKSVFCPPHIGECPNVNVGAAGAGSATTST